MVHVVLDKLVKFGVKLGLFVALVRIGTAVRKLHQPLKRDPDGLTPVVAGDAGFMGYARVDLVVDQDFGLALRLDRMNHGASGLVPLDAGVGPLVEPGIVVGDMAGVTSHAPGSLRVCHGP